MRYTLRHGVVRKIKTRLINTTLAGMLLASSLSGSLPLLFAPRAFADSPTVVTPVSQQGWYTTAGDAATGSSLGYVDASDAPLGSGALKLTTSDNNSVVHLTHDFSVALKDINKLSYETKQLSATDTRNGNATMRINVDLDGNGTIDQLMYEPYYNGFNGTTQAGWQNWNVMTGKFWSNYGIDYGTGVAGAGSYATNFTLQDVLAKYSDATVTGIVVSMGSYNPYQQVLVDNVELNDSTYDFNPVELAPCSTTNTVSFNSLDDWDLSQSRVNGHNQLTTNGLHVWTDGLADTGSDGSGGTWNTDKAAGYYPVSFALANLGEGFGLSATTSNGSVTPPALQLTVDLDGNGTPEGNLVAEPGSYGPDTLWLSSNWTGIDLSNAPTTVNGGGTGKGGTVNAWLAAFPNAKVMAIGYSLGSGVFGNYVISSLTANCTTYTFALTPTAAPTNLKFNYKDANEGDHTLACGGGINSVKPNQYHLSGSLNLNWTAPTGTVDGYQVLITYPNGDTELTYQGSNPWAWLQFTHGQGKYTYEVRSSNTAGPSDYSLPCSIYYDTHSPSAQFTQAPADSSTVSGNFQVAATASDNVALSAVGFDIRDPHDTTGNAWRAGCVNGTFDITYNADRTAATLSCEMNTAGLVEGTPYYVRVHASDYAGYGSPDTVPLSIRNFTVDRTTPAVPDNLSWTDSNGHTVINGGSTNLYAGTASWQDSSSDVDHYVYKYWNDIPGNQYKVGSEYTVNVTGTSLPGVFNQGDGVHHFCVEAVDAAGNTSACSATFTITYDSSAPVVTDTFTRSMLTGDKVTLAPTVSGETGPVTYAWSVSDSHLLNNPNESTTGSSLLIGPAPKGTYTVTLTVTDQVGNSTTKQYTVTIATHANNQLSFSQNNSFQPQVLGATTGTNGSGNGNGNGTGNGGGNTDNGSGVKGASTSIPNTPTVNFANANYTHKTSAFLWLGWWWLAVVAGLAFFWWILGIRRRSDND